MSPSEKAKLVLFVALLLLCLSGIATAFTIIRLRTSESWVRHTYDVEVALGDEESALADVGRHRVAYVDSGTPESLQAFWKATSAVPVGLARIGQLTADNPAQWPLLEHLRSNANARVVPSVTAVQLKQQNQIDSSKEVQLTTEVATAASETAAITLAMRQNEDSLLKQHSQASGLLFTITLWILALSLVSSALMFGVHYRLLSRELRERRAAEDHLHQLSGQLMRVQDEERRRLSRELHDGLGQNLVAAKMAADALAGKYRGEQRLGELAAVLSDSLSQTRTISYLLHPPLLDEIGFASAARWFIEGYSNRTGLEVSADIPAEIERLPRTLELVLFRILQEALTNIHRHAKSASAEVSVCLAPGEVSLVVRDYGQGIPSETLANFGNGTHMGVGLAGMKERVRELGGKLEIRSQSSGTEIAVRLPMPGEMQARVPAPVTRE